MGVRSNLSADSSGRHRPYLSQPEVDSEEGTDRSRETGIVVDLGPETKAGPHDFLLFSVDACEARAAFSPRARYTKRFSPLLHQTNRIRILRPLPLSLLVASAEVFTFSHRGGTAGMKLCKMQVVRVCLFLLAAVPAYCQRGTFGIDVGQTSDKFDSL